jgi:uncharacterized damage-inducible protein DinB
VHRRIYTKKHTETILPFQGRPVLKREKASKMDFKDSPFHKILEPDMAEVSADAAGIEKHFRRVSEFIAAIPPGRKDHAYAEGKWPITVVLGHIIDAQAVFLYRFLNIARGETVALPGFQEELWVANGGYGNCALPELKSLYDKAAAHTQCMALRMGKTELARRGNANGIAISAEEVLVYLMAHEVHHIKVIRERYLGV